MCWRLLRRADGGRDLLLREPPWRRKNHIGAQLPDDEALSVSGWAVVGWQSLESASIDVGDPDGE